MAMANRNLMGVFVTKLWPVQALACGGGGGGDGGDGGDGGATKNIISPKLSNYCPNPHEKLTKSDIMAS